MRLLTEYTELADLEILKENVEEGKKPIYKVKGPFIRAEVKNRNGRKYSYQTLLREVSNFQEKILKKKAIGALDHPSCMLSNDFDVLTENGWKSFNDLKEGENVLTLNDNDEIEIQPIEKKIEQFYEGYGYQVTARNIHSSFTPNHRFLLEDRYGKKFYITLEEIYNNRIKYNHCKILKNAKWKGNNQDYVIIPKVEINEKDRYKYLNDVTEDLKIDSMLFCQFLGIYLSKGCISNKKYRIFIGQKSGEKADQIEEMLKNLPFELNVSYSKKRDYKVFNFSDRRLWEYLKPLGDKYVKYIPFEIKQLNAECLGELLDFFILGDGRNQLSKEGYQRKNLFSVSKKLVEDLHECLIKSGGSGNWQKIIPTKDHILRGKMIYAKDCKPLYQLTISSTKGIYLKNNLKIEKIDHSGNVYCLSVKNSNFYMKQNNKAFWTGNSPTVSLADASHLIESLQMVGNDGVGIAKILNTPKGLIAQTLIDEGIILGVSSRGVGTLADGNVNDDYKLITIDLVSDPSASTYVDSILENKEYFITESGIIMEKAIENLQTKVDKKANSKEISKYLKDFFIEIGKNA